MTTPSIARPPAWAEAALRLLLAPADRDAVSGDLLEEYRDGVVRQRGRWRADIWYVRQAAGFVWRRVWLWGLLLAVSVIFRDTLDWWLSPTDEFYARSVVSTAVAVGVFTGAGMWTAWRSRSVRAGAFAGLATGVISAAIVNLASLAMLAVWHDPHTMAMIKASGGLDEVFALPLIVVVPGTISAAIGAIAGKALAWSLRSRLAE